MKVRQLIGENQIFKKLYDVVRIVNPMTKEVIDEVYFKHIEIETKDIGPAKYCYQFWGDEGVCENCSSQRAFNEKEVFMKTEFNGKDVYMVTSLPVEDEGRPYIFEAIVEITDKELLNELQGRDYFEIKRILKNRNHEIVLDSLTKAYNRRFIDERLPFEVIEAQRMGESMIIAMADIDYFKKINDTFGHDAGDQVLKEFIEVIQKNIRLNSDWVARYGGEEFVIFMKTINEEKAFEKIEGIRKSIENHVFQCEGENISVTCSFGLSVIEENDTAESWLKRADQNLYKSKNNGRNRVTVDRRD